MSARKRLWKLQAPAPDAFLIEQRAYHPLIATLLYQRGLRDAPSIRAFLSSDYRGGLHDPFSMLGMDVAAQRLASAIQSREPIAVYGDFDADGVTAVTLLTQAITAMGGVIQPYIPHRMREGYGLNHVATDRLVQQGVRLLVTVDCGISNVDEVAHARSQGLDVIVTDHHTPPDVLPNAYAVVNPKQPGCAYPYKNLVGVGIAYKLVQALVRLGMKMPLRGRDLLDVVALGTVTDMGPLDGENRVLVKAGLESVNASERPGLQALIGAAGLVQGRVTAGDISYMLGPRLNAAGRLDDAVLAYKLLLAENTDTALQMARELNEKNTLRQRLTQQVQQAARKEIDARGKAKNRIIVLEDAAFPAGVVGLVAAKLVEEFGRPVLLISREGDLLRGSARSVPGFSIIDALTDCADLFVRYGGHVAAAGFTLDAANLPTLEARLQAYAEPLLAAEPQITLDIDAEIPLAEVHLELFEQLQTLEPFGQGNPLPVLMSRQVRAVAARTIGTEGQHLKLTLENGAGGPQYQALAWHLGHLAGFFTRPIHIDIAYTLNLNEWNGTRKLQLVVKDFRRAQ